MEYQDDAPQSAKPWLDAITNAEKAFEKYNKSADKVEKHYADLEKLAKQTGGEFQIFWANMEILRPSVYQRPPNPVVMPRHSDTGEVVRKASEMLERALDYDVEADDLHEVLLQVRDDVCLVGRGVPWVLDNGHAIHVDRHDFLHDPARKWSEVNWVARRVWLTKEQGVERFGDKFKKIQTKEQDKPGDYGTDEKKAEVWEIWDKEDRTVCWVAEGCEEVLDRVEAFIDVKGFFPCPKPAYATLEPHTLKPVPDFHFYAGQVDEVRALTRRINALAESLRVKGFYAAGTSEVGEAIEAAMAQTNDKSVLVPVSSAAAMGNLALKDSIVWLPVAEVAQVISACVELRKQLIEDIYEITGLSDIMRGVTQAQETLGAQNLKAQYGSVRVREKQAEMVRVSLEVLRIKAEIFAENFDVQELMQMAGMQIPTMQQIQQMQAQQQPQGEPPQEMPKVTLEQVAQLLQNERIRAFSLEVETDSTIAPNEEAEKQDRVEFLGAVGQFLGQAGDLVEREPAAAPFMAELLKFGVGAFRAGRDLGGEIDQFAEQIKAKAAQAQEGQQPDPETMKVQAQAQKDQAEIQIKQQELALKQQDMEIRAQEIAAKQQEAAQTAQTRDYDAKVSAAVKQFELSLKAKELGLKVDEQRLKEQQAEIQALLDMEELELEREQKRPVRIGD